MSIMTVGHSSHSWPIFAQLLDRHDVGLVVDVRSRPRSRLGHFNKPELRFRLNGVGISYVHLGDELGGLSGNGAADYVVMAKSTPFLCGIGRILDLAARTRLALLCAEHEPLECHRCLLIGRHLAGLGEEIKHILRDGSCEPHAVTEDRLLAALSRTEDDLLATREARLGEAYAIQAQRLQRGLKLPQSRLPRRNGADASSR